MKLIKLKVTNDRDLKNFKVIEVPCNMTLYKFAEFLLKSFGFYFDHAFGFYDNIKKPLKSKVIFELSSDIKDIDHNPDAKGVKKFYVDDLFESNQKMFFLFDYCDTWHFHLEFLDDSMVYEVPKITIKYMNPMVRIQFNTLRLMSDEFWHISWHKRNCFRHYSSPATSPTH